MVFFIVCTGQITCRRGYVIPLAIMNGAWACICLWKVMCADANMDHASCKVSSDT